MRKNFLYRGMMLLASALTIASCTDNAEELRPQSDSNRLQLTFGVNQQKSRAIHTDATLPDASPVGVKLDGYSYTGLTYTGTTTSGKQTWAPNQDVVLSETSGTLYAYWPYSESIDMTAIPVDMTADDQTDWLYATPVPGINEDNASANVVMNHAAANISITINKGTYLGSGAISNISIQSDAFATGGTFNAAQAEPAFTAYEGEGEPLSRSVKITTGTATDIMVVPTGTTGTISFIATIDDIPFTVTTPSLTIERGNSYQYTLNLSDINTYMTIDGLSVTPWSNQSKGEFTMDEYVDKNIYVYAVSANNQLIDYTTANNTAKGVAIVAGKHKFMIAKKDATDGTNTTFYWDYDMGDLTLTNFVYLDKINKSAYLPLSDGSYADTPHFSPDFTTWEEGALSDFKGKSNTAVILASSNHSLDMCKVLETFNAGTNPQNNEGFTDWYVPACGQLA